MKPKTCLFSVNKNQCNTVQNEDHCYSNIKKRNDLEKMFVDLLCRFDSVRSIKDVLRLLASVSGFTTEEVCSIE